MSPPRSRRSVHHEAVQAWRTWRVGVFEPAASPGPEYFLRSCVHDAYWPPTEPLVSQCPEHLRPDLGCGCGIYAMTSRDAAVAWARSTAHSLAMPVVVGQVHLWGRTLQFTHGYRAELAYPYSIEVLDDGLTADLDAAAVVRQLRETYLVDVTRVTPAA